MERIQEIMLINKSGINGGNVNRVIQALISII